MNRTLLSKLAVVPLLAGLAAAFVMASPGGAGGPSGAEAVAPDKERSHRLFERMLASRGDARRDVGEPAAPAAREPDDRDPDLADDIRAQLRSQQVSEGEARAYFEQNRALFGDRGFAESRFTVERLIAIERVQAALE